MPLLSGRLGNPFARRAMSLLALTSLVGYLSLVEASGPANAITGPYTTVFLGNITSTTNAAISNDPPGDPNRTAADPSAVVSDSHGNLIFADSDGAIVLLQESAANPGYPVDSLYVWEPGETRVLGGGGSDALEASGTPALSTDLGTPSAVALDPSGNVVFADNSNGVVGVLAVSSLEPAHLHLGGTWQVGDVYLLAGDPSGASPTTSGSIAVATALTAPGGLVVDVNENVVIADSSEVEVLAENTSIPYTSASATVGDLYVIAGGGGSAPTTSGTLATSTQLGAVGVAAGAAGDLVVADENGGEVLVLAESSSSVYGIASPAIDHMYVIAGGGVTVPSASGLSADSSSIDPAAVVVDADGNVLIADEANGAVEMLAESTSSLNGISSPSIGNVYRVAGGDLLPEISGVPMTETDFTPSNISVDTHGNILAVDQSAEQIQLLCTVSCASYTVTDPPDPFTTPAIDDAYVIVGSSPDYSAVYNAQPQFDWQGAQGQLVDDNAGNLVVADPGHHAIELVWLSHSETSAYQLSTPRNAATYLIAGAESGDLPLSTSGSPATATELPNPTGVAVDAAGNVLISDSTLGRLAVLAEGATPAYGISPGSWTDGDIYLLAGGGLSTPGPAGIAATDVSLSSPGELAVDPAGNVILSENVASAIDVVAESSSASYGVTSGAWHVGDVYRIAGDSSGSTPAPSGTVATSTDLLGVQSIAVDSSGNVLIGENFEVDVIAEASAAAYGIAQGSWNKGSLYVIAGDDSSGPPTATASGSEALSTPVDPTGLAIDRDGNVVIADTLNFSVDVLAENSTVVGYGITDWIPTDLYMVAGSPAGSTFPWAFTSPADTNWLPAGVVADPINGLVVADAASGDLETYLSEPSAVPAVFGTPGTGSVSLSWSPPTMQSTEEATVPSYTVEVYPTGSNTSIKSQGAGTADSTSVGGLSPGSSYQFTVVASNQIGEAQPSAKSASILLPATPTTTTIPPSVPTTTSPPTFPSTVTTTPPTVTTTTSPPLSLVPSPKLVSVTKSNVAMTVSAPRSVFAGASIEYSLVLKPARSGSQMTGTLTASTRVSKKVRGRTETTTLDLGKASVKSTKVSITLKTNELGLGAHTITLTYSGNSRLKAASSSQFIAVKPAIARR